MKRTLSDYDLVIYKSGFWDIMIGVILLIISIFIYLDVGNSTPAIYFFMFFLYSTINKKVIKSRLGKDPKEDEPAGAKHIVSIILTVSLVILLGFVIYVRATTKGSCPFSFFAMRPGLLTYVIFGTITGFVAFFTIFNKIYNLLVYLLGGTSIYFILLQLNVEHYMAISLFSCGIVATVWGVYLLLKFMNEYPKLENNN